jgi:hypothetical protein
LTLRDAVNLMMMVSDSMATNPGDRSRDRRCRERSHGRARPDRHASCGASARVAKAQRKIAGESEIRNWPQFTAGMVRLVELLERGEVVSPAASRRWR